MLKYWKLNNIKSLKSDEKEEKINIEKDNELQIQDNKINKNDKVANLIKSEERWKLK